MKGGSFDDSPLEACSRKVEPDWQQLEGWEMPEVEVKMGMTLKQADMVATENTLSTYYFVILIFVCLLLIILEFKRICV